MNLEVIILAAGQGTRMKSSLPKVLHKVAGRPLLEHVVRAAQELEPLAIHVVVGHGAAQVEAALAAYPLRWVLQAEQLGTGHAVLQAMPAIAQDSTVLVLYGDVPLLGSATLKRLVEKAQRAPALLTAVVENPYGLGRIIRGERGVLLEVVEEKDATDKQRLIEEVNTGVLAAPAADLCEYLPQVGSDNKQGEYYLPDILSLAVEAGKTIGSCEASSELEVQGVNDRAQLNQVEREYQRLQANELMREGVSIADSNRLDIRGSLCCGDDVSIDVNVVIEGRVELGSGVTIGPNCVLIDVAVADGASIHAFSHLQDCVVGKDCSVGPYARLRPGTTLGEAARVGNFVEMKKSTIGAGSKVNHLSYVGDCEMGDGVNIGAGTITCNYDGVNKSKTEIGNGVFVGSNSTLVAPVTIAEGGFVGAGSTVTRAVGKNELAVSRARQKNIHGWQRPTKKAGD
ncbi:MAG: bifunctional UDP-N-acetylglucosamine diphosphorylase/glucosamine-1-phosphate N-acetyltransferase GlmU [Proteobacteria bacterium]|nr:bifunctional UDP-N-acetylglucosamine diphosphorylase/glucosamine-1-phosphate N-acetyltransferase GlmU [Pseudomonadota bacterium]